MLTNKIFNASALKETVFKGFPLGSAALLSLVSKSAHFSQQTCRA